MASCRALTSLWVARHHLWLSQSQLQTDDQNCLLRLPVVPSPIFGPGATTMLEQARDARRCAWEMLGVLQSNRSRWVSRAPRAVPRAAAPQPMQAAPDDLRVQLDTARQSRAGRGRRMGRGEAEGLVCPRLAPDSLGDPAPSWGRPGRQLGPWVVSTMTQGYRLQFLRVPPQTRSVRFTVVADSQHRGILAAEIDTLLAKRAIRVVLQTNQPAGVFSRYFLIPKKDRSLRPILDLRGLNTFLRPLRCKMLSVPRVHQSILQGDWVATIDLEDAYFQIPIWEGHRRLLMFALGGRTFEFCVLPFAISQAPRTFTRGRGTVLAPLRGQGLRILNYLDNWLVCARSEEQCRSSVDWLLQHMEHLGLCLNRKPSQSTEFLGMCLDARAGTVSLTPVRQAALRACLSQFRLGAKVPWRLCLCLLGLMASTVHVMPSPEYAASSALPPGAQPVHRETCEPWCQ